MVGYGSYSSNRSQSTSPISTLSSLYSHRIDGPHQSYNLKLLKEMERQVTFSKFHSPSVSPLPVSLLSLDTNEHIHIDWQMDLLRMYHLFIPPPLVGSAKSSSDRQISRHLLRIHQRHVPKLVRSQELQSFLFLLSDRQFKEEEG